MRTKPLMGAIWVTDLGSNRKSTSIAHVTFRTKCGTHLFILTCSQLSSDKHNGPKLVPFQQEVSVLEGECHFLRAPRLL